MLDPYTTDLDTVMFKLRHQFGLMTSSGIRYVWDDEPDPMGPRWRPQVAPGRPLRPRELLRLMRDVFGYEVRRAMGRPRRVRRQLPTVGRPSDHFRVSGVW